MIEVMSPSGNITNIANVTVSWSGILQASKQDRVIAYLPDAPQMEKWITFKSIPEGSITTGTGSVILALPNVRLPYHFQYYNQLTNTTFESEDVVEVDVDYPTQGHIAYTSNLKEMRVMWVSGTRNVPTVMYGFDPSSLTSEATGTSWTYNVTDMCGKKVNPDGDISINYFLDPGWIHSVILPNLLSNTTYYYKFGTSGKWSETFSFVSAQQNFEVEKTTTRLMVVADAGTSNCEWELSINMCSNYSGPTYAAMKRELERQKYDMLLYNGDLSYASGIAHTWEYYFAEMESITTQVPYMVSVGNHEAGWSDEEWMKPWNTGKNQARGECGVPYSNRHIMPNTTLEQSRDRVWWWSMDYPLVHIVAISTESAFGKGSKQYEWLKSDLANVNRSKTPWIIIMGHRPMYFFPEVTNNEWLDHFREIEPLMNKYEVNLALWGHNHVYQRMCPSYQRQCRGNSTHPGGTVHILAGNGGQANDPLPNDPDRTFFEYLSMHWGYLRIEIQGNSTLQVEFLTPEDVIEDTVVLHQSRFPVEPPSWFSELKIDHGIVYLTLLAVGIPLTFLPVMIYWKIKNSSWKRNFNFQKIGADAKSNQMELEQMEDGKHEIVEKNTDE
eukprot:TRINITY_DN1359_c0_g1_i4.p1 TRINITY_DN1359_c0_g1~~TRINITY_DN1359_c0_g1_i4.p1  ORF type:complete len:646 (-),score=157.05 TRINITY_DN1359_c0_g1_i4:34-1869(-)